MPATNNGGSGLPLHDNRRSFMVNGGGVDIMTTMERGPAGWNFEERISRIQTVNGKMAPPER